MENSVDQNQALKFYSYEIKTRDIKYDKKYEPNTVLPYATIF